MTDVVIRTTPERIAAVLHELETAWIGNARGRLLSAFAEDCRRAVVPEILPGQVPATTLDAIQEFCASKPNGRHR